MIIHYNHDKPVQVYVVNLRLPVYRASYGDGLGNTIIDLFTRLAPKIASLAKQVGMKSIDIIRDKGVAAVGNLASKAFFAAKDKIISSVRRRGKQSVMLLQRQRCLQQPYNEINNAVEEKVAELATPPSDAQSSAIANMIAGSGLKLRRRRLKLISFTIENTKKL